MIQSKITGQYLGIFILEDEIVEHKQKWNEHMHGMVSFEATNTN